VNEFRPSVLPQYPKDPTQVIYGSKTSHLKVHLRNQSQYISSKSKDDENPTVNKIPHSPISMKRAISPQMLGSIDDYTDTDNLYTENSTFESGDLREPHHIHFPSYPIKNGSINFTKIKPVQESITNTTLNVTPHDFHSFSSLNDITNAKGAQCIRMSANIETGTENLYSIQKMEGFQKAFQREELPSMSYRPPTEVNNNDKSSPTKVVCSSMNSGIKNGELKSPGRVRRDQVSLSLKTKPSPIKDFDQGGAKASNKAILQTSPPKGRFTSVPTENKNSSTFDGVKTYFNKLNKFDLSKSTSIIRHIFQPKKRLKCSCDINLDENETCSKALAWIKKKYNPNEFSYLKSTYEKILSDGKLVEVEYARQIQKDLPRTSPQNKYFAENSEG